NADTLYDRTGKMPCMGGVTGENTGAKGVVRELYESSAVLPKLITLSNFWVELELAYSRVWDGADPEQTLKTLSEQMREQVKKF
ncbi:MAG: sugar ABC transporter substrate-binding protein, partial [Lachnospiraceae bacterium]|nr:sugar ABC transporter substrate-binding protein [Lachnospiraceae bacterium]